MDKGLDINYRFIVNNSSNIFVAIYCYLNHLFYMFGFKVLHIYNNIFGKHELTSCDETMMKNMNT